MSKDEESSYHDRFTGLLVAADGTKRWFVNGVYGRLDSGPSVEYPDGSYCYYLHSYNQWKKLYTTVLHRTSGPAIAYSDGTRYYYELGHLHRDPHEGPAVIYSDGTTEYWVNGRRLGAKEAEECRKAAEAAEHFQKYGDPKYPISEWKKEVLSRVTRFGYAAWLAHKIPGADLSEYDEDYDTISALGESQDLLAAHFDVAPSTVSDRLIIQKEQEIIKDFDSEESSLYKRKKLKSKKKFDLPLDIPKHDNHHKLFTIEQWISNVEQDLTKDSYVEWVDLCEIEMDEKFNSDHFLGRASAWAALKRLAAYFQVDNDDVVAGLLFYERLRVFRDYEFDR